MKPVDEYLNHRYAILLENGGYTPETETDVSIISGTNVSCVGSSVKIKSTRDMYRFFYYETIKHKNSTKAGSLWCEYTTMWYMLSVNLNNHLKVLSM